MSVRRPEPLSFTHSLAYVYLFMAHHGDREGLTPSELQKIVTKIREWNDQFSPNAMVSVQVSIKEVNETWSYFAALTPDEEKVELALHVLALQRFLPEKRHKVGVIADMIAIAEADGKVTDGEKAIIALVHQHLGL